MKRRAPWTSERRERQVAAYRASWTNARRSDHSTIMRKVWADSERNTALRREWTPEETARMAASVRASWNDPKSKAARIKRLWSPAAARKRLASYRAWLATEGARESLSVINVRRWTDPAFRETFRAKVRACPRGIRAAAKRAKVEAARAARAAELTDRYKAALSCHRARGSGIGISVCTALLAGQSQVEVARVFGFSRARVNQLSMGRR